VCKHAVACWTICFGYLTCMHIYVCACVYAYIYVCILRSGELNRARLSRSLKCPRLRIAEFQQLTACCGRWHTNCVLHSLYMSTKHCPAIQLANLGRTGLGQACLSWYRLTSPPLCAADHLSTLFRLCTVYAALCTAHYPPTPTLFHLLTPGIDCHLIHK
jgi:hypothetical protein